MLQEIRNKLHEKLLVLRNVDRYVNSEEFETTFNGLNDEQREKVKIYIDEMELDAVKGIMTTNRHLYEMSLRELRQAAKRICIPYYTRLPKSTLLSELIGYEKAKERSLSGTRKIIARDQNST